MKTTVVVIPGDGIGPEVVKATVDCLKAVASDLVFEEHPAGLEHFEASGELLPQTTIDAIEKHKLAIKGPTNTPVGTGHRSINVLLRKHFNLFANVRPIKNLPGVSTRYENVDLVIVRENTEDLYAGIEQMVDANVAESIKRISKGASEAICRHAFELARSQGKTEVVCVHKANIMKLTDGLFLRTFQEVASNYPEITAKDLIVDNTCMQLVTRPERFQVIVTENLYGDILSDLCAGLVGGLGVAPGANIGKDMALFEAVHGSAPDIAGQNKANPTALILSAVMLLEHLKKTKEAAALKSALIKTLENPEDRTGDLGGKSSTTEFTKKVISNL